MQLVELLKKVQSILHYRLFEVGPEKVVTPMTLLLALGILLGAVWISRILGRILTRPVKEPSVQYTLRSLTRYLVIAIGALVAADHVGFDLSTLAVFGGLFGVGIGFGLQNIFSNFASGLILLLERPIKVGDYIEVGGREGWVETVQLRVTILNTRDNETYVVPNSDLVSGVVRNWSYRDPRVRIGIPIGVAYGSDLEKVRRTLLAAAEIHPEVMKDPAPDVLFVEHGDSSLNLVLRIWLQSPRHIPSVKSDIRFEIDRKFRAEEVRIPFPQRDVHFFPAGQAA